MGSRMARVWRPDSAQRGQQLARRSVVPVRPRPPPALALAVTIGKNNPVPFDNIRTGKRAIGSRPDVCTAVGAVWLFSSAICRSVRTASRVLTGQPMPAYGN